MLRLTIACLAGVLAFAGVLLDPVPASAAALAARSSDAAGVRVVVTPTTLGSGTAVWEFQVVMDTHTKPLDENLVQTAVLVDDAGRRYAPIAWQGDPPGGHHRKGVLKFSAPAALPAAVELRIDGVGGTGARTFRWELK